jgi:hypothetical protein
MSYEILVSNGYISSDFDRRSFKFCFVRNPWDRLVSLYFYLKKIGFIHKNKKFRTFLYEIEDDALPRIGLFHTKSRVLSQCNRQLDWITDANGRIFVDFIGKYESIDSDFRTLCDKLEIHRDLPRRNITPHSHYSEYYDQKTRRIVEKVYAQDIEYFGYRFGE